MSILRMLLTITTAALFAATLETALPAQGTGVSAFRIELTDTPPQDCGGPTKQASIAGKITGPVAADHRILIYAAACNGILYVQPTIAAPMTAIADGTFNSYIHLGHTYYVLLVKNTYKPKPEISETDLPRIGGEVAAMVKVPGKK